MIVSRVAFVRVAAVMAALTLTSLMVLRTSSAAFSDTTTASGNWTSGTVVLDDDDANAALFTATNLAPGDVVTRCITVQYRGSIPTAAIKLYGTATGTLGQYLNVTVERGTGGNFGTCTGFTSAATVFTGTLAGFASAHTNYGNGTGTYTTTATPNDTTFRFVATLQDTNDAQNKTAAATFTWEAQETQDRALYGG